MIIRDFLRFFDDFQSLVSSFGQALLIFIQNQENIVYSIIACYIKQFNEIYYYGKIDKKLKRNLRNIFKNKYSELPKINQLIKASIF